MFPVKEKCLFTKVFSIDPRKGVFKNINHIKAARTIDSIAFSKSEQSQDPVNLRNKTNNQILDGYRYTLDKLFIFLTGVSCGMFIIFTVYIFSNFNNREALSTNTLRPCQILYILSLVASILSSEQLIYYKGCFNRAVETEKPFLAKKLEKKIFFSKFHFGILMSIFFIQLACYRLAAYVSTAKDNEALNSHKTQRILISYNSLELINAILSLCGWSLGSFLQESSRKVYSITDTDKNK